MYIQYVEFYGILSVCLLPEDRKTDIHMCEPERVSVIVPVFNVEEYLEEALDSLLMQTYRNLEILVVDDGSTDGSGKICDEYAKKDKRIQVIHQENQGLSGARNTALDLMTGELVMFLDPDDAYHPDIVKKLVEARKKEQSDIALCRFDFFHTSSRMYRAIACKHVEPTCLQGNYTRIEALHELAAGKINVHVWNKIYTRKLWNDIRFPDGHVYEDVKITYEIMNHIEKICVLDDVLYWKRVWQGAITSVFSENNVRDCVLSLTMRDQYIQEHIQDVFSCEQLYQMERIKLEYLINIYFHYYPKQDSGRQFAKEMRQTIIEIQKKISLSQCCFRTRFFFPVLRYLCPAIMKYMYPIYRLFRISRQLIMNR